MKIRWPVSFQFPCVIFNIIREKKSNNISTHTRANTVHKQAASNEYNDIVHIRLSLSRTSKCGVNSKHKPTHDGCGQMNVRKPECAFKDKQNVK